MLTTSFLKKSSKYLLFKPSRLFSVGIGYPPKPEENPVKFNFIYAKGGKVKEVLAREGETILEVAHNNKIDLEGACGQCRRCSTCHVVLEEPVYDKLPQPDIDEMDLLDLAYGHCLTSRLGCQVKVNKDLEGINVKIFHHEFSFREEREKLKAEQRAQKELEQSGLHI